MQSTEDMNVIVIWAFPQRFLGEVVVHDSDERMLDPTIHSSEHTLRANEKRASPPIVLVIKDMSAEKICFRNWA